MMAQSTVDNGQLLKYHKSAVLLCRSAKHTDFSSNEGQFIRCLSVPVAKSDLYVILVSSLYHARGDMGTLE
jgi:hypothetical protein